MMEVSSVVASEDDGTGAEAAGDGASSVVEDVASAREDGVFAMQVSRARSLLGGWSKHRWRHHLSGREVPGQHTMDASTIAYGTTDGSSVGSDLPVPGDELRVVATQHGIISVDMSSFPGSEGVPWHNLHSIQQLMRSGSYTRPNLHQLATNGGGKTILLNQQKSLEKWGEGTAATDEADSEGGSGTSHSHAETLPGPFQPLVLEAQSLFLPVVEDWLYDRHGVLSLSHVSDRIEREEKEMAAAGPDAGLDPPSNFYTFKGSVEHFVNADYNATPESADLRHALSEKDGPAVVAAIEDRLRAAFYGVEANTSQTNSLHLPSLPHLTSIDMNDGEEIEFSLIAKGIFRDALRAGILKKNSAATKRLHSWRSRIGTSTETEKDAGKNGGIGSNQQYRVPHVVGHQSGTVNLGAMPGLHGGVLTKDSLTGGSLMASVTLGSLGMASVQIPSSAQPPYKRTAFVQHQPNDNLQPSFWEDPAPVIEGGPRKRGGRLSGRDLENKAYLESALDVSMPSPFVYPFSSRLFVEDYTTQVPAQSPPGGRGVVASAVLGLLDAGVPLTSFPVDLRVGIISDLNAGKVCIVEPTPLEESICDAVLSVAASCQDKGKGEVIQRVTTLRLRSLTGKPIRGPVLFYALSFASFALEAECLRRREEVVQLCEGSGRRIPAWVRRMTDKEAKSADAAHANVVLPPAATVREMADRVRAKRLRAKYIGMGPVSAQANGASSSARLPCAALVPFPRDLFGRLRGFAGSNEWFVEENYGVTLKVFDDVEGPLSINGDYDAWGRRTPAMVHPKTLKGGITGLAEAVGVSGKPEEQVYAYIFSEPDVHKSRRPREQMHNGGHQAYKPSLSLGAQERLEGALEVIEPTILDVHPGEQYFAEVVQVLDYGAIVRLTPSHEALLHVRDAAVLTEAWEARHGNAPSKPSTTDLLHEGQRVFVDVTDRGKEHIHVRVIAPEGRVDMASVDASRLEAEDLQPIPLPMSQSPTQRSTELQDRLFMPWDPEPVAVREEGDGIIDDDHDRDHDHDHDGTPAAHDM